MWDEDLDIQGCDGVNECEGHPRKSGVTANWR